MSSFQGSRSKASSNDSKQRFSVRDNDKRSGPAGSLSQQSTAQPLASTPSQTPLPQTLYITVSTAHGVPTTLAASGNHQENALYHIYTQTVRAPHLCFFGAGPSGAEEIARATISDKGDSITCVVRQRISVSVKSKSRFSSSFLATVSSSAGTQSPREIIWKGDRQALQCVDASSGVELLSVEMGKPSKKDDWVVKGECVFADGGMGVGEEVREALLVSGLAVQECKGRKGQGIWGTIGKGGLSSVVI